MPKLPIGVLMFPVTAPWTSPLRCRGFGMDEALGHEITELLQAWRQGDEGALEKLTPQVYRELHLKSPCAVLVRSCQIA